MSSTEGRAGGHAGIGFVGWWARWWLDTRGPVLGVVVPVVLAVVATALDAKLVPLALAGGLAAGLLWPMGKAAKALVIVGGIVAFVVATGGAGLLLLFAMLIGWGLAALVVGVLYLWIKGMRIEPHYGARWASEEETRDMNMWEEESRPGEGVSLALHHGDLVGVKEGFEDRREMGHFLVCGPSRSGKSLHLITNLMFWLGSAIALDIKGELYRLTAGMRKEMGSEVLVLDPQGRGSRYDPFRDLSRSPEALRSAVELVMETEKGRDPVFAQRGAYGLYAALLGAKVEGAPSLAYVRELTAEGPMTFVERLSRLDDPEIRRALIDFLGRKPEETSAETFSDDRFLSSSWSTMTARLQSVLSDGILRMTGGSDFEAADLIRNPSTLYLMFREGELKYTRKIFQVVMLALVTGLVRHADLKPDEERVPLLLALDEAGRTPIPSLDDMVSTIGGRGMSALIYVQDLGQLVAAYGRDEAGVIRGNCHNQLYYRPTDHDTAAHVSRLCGQTSVEDVHVSGTFGEKRSYGQRPRELVTPDEVRQIPHEHVIVFAGRKPPIYAHRLEWFEIFDEEKVGEAVPPEVTELPLPKVSMGGQDGRAEPERQGPWSDPPKQSRRRRRRQEGEEEKEVGGYVEPDV